MKVIRNFNNAIMAESAKAILSGENIEAIVLGDNLSITGGPEFGNFIIQLAIMNDDDFELANMALNNCGIK